MFAQCKSYLLSLSNNSFYTSLKARSFHTSLLLQKRHSKDIKRKNLMKKVSKLQQEKLQKPNVITGVPTTFTNSFLRPSQVYASTTAVQASKLSSENNHQYRNYFLDQKDEEFLFNITPTIITEHSTQGDQVKIESRELEKVQILKNLTSLHNANSKSILLYNIQLAIKEFARKEGDTGSAEVQAAVWTAKILNLNEHIKNNHKDKHNYRALRQMVHKRQSILKYLKTQDLGRYFTCLKKLGLDQKSIEGEIVM